MDLYDRAAQPGMTEHEHHAWGALLKNLEALAVAYRYDRYAKNSKTGKLIEHLLGTVYQLRDQLAHEYAWVATEHLRPKTWRDYEGHQTWSDALHQALTSDVYYGEAVHRLHLQMCLLESAPTGRMRKLLAPDPDQRENFMTAVEQLAGAARGPAQQLPWETPAAPLLAPPSPIPHQWPGDDRHTALRNALIENPDQPQAVFVERFHVHPITVRRTRSELEEAGAIPFLAHRHGPANTSRRHAHLAEAAD